MHNIKCANCLQEVPNVTAIDGLYCSDDCQSKYTHDAWRDERIGLIVNTFYPGIRGEYAETMGLTIAQIRNMNRVINVARLKLAGEVRAGIDNIAEAECKHCGAEVRLSMNSFDEHKEKGTPIYCTQACADQDKGPGAGDMTSIKCDYCGNLYPVSANDAEEIVKHGYPSYCSEDCSHRDNDMGDPAKQ